MTTMVAPLALLTCQMVSLKSSSSCALTQTRPSLSSGQGMTSQAGSPCRRSPLVPRTSTTYRVGWSSGSTWPCSTLPASLGRSSIGTLYVARVPEVGGQELTTNIKQTNGFRLFEYNGEHPSFAFGKFPSKNVRFPIIGNRGGKSSILLHPWSTNHCRICKEIK